MKISTASFFSAVAVLMGLASVSSCSKSDKIAGSWQGQPERLAHTADAADVMSTMTMDFVPATDGTKGGKVEYSAVIEVQQPVYGSVGMDVDYEQGISATASINGRYVYSDDDDEDVLVNLDLSSLNVQVDSDGVMYRENALDSEPAPTLDSLRAVTVEKWRVVLVNAVREQFYRYTKIDDIKVHHDEMMSCEVDDRDMTFRRVGVPD